MSIDVKEYLNLLWSQTWLILLAGALAGAVAFVVSYFTVPVYQSSLRLLVSEPPAVRGVDSSAIVSSQSMTSTYAEMLVDRPVLQGVIDEIGLSIAPDSLKRNIHVETIRGTQLLIVTVNDTQPERAAQVANTLGDVFARRIRELQNQRYSATKQALEKQINDIEEQINLAIKESERETNSEEKLQTQSRITEYRRIYSNLVTNYEQVRLAEAQTSTNIIVSQPAISSPAPILPQTNRNVLLGALAGMTLAMLVVLVFEMLDDTIKNPDEIRQRFHQPVLGIIPRHNLQQDSLITLT